MFSREDRKAAIRLWRYLTRLCVQNRLNKKVTSIMHGCIIKKNDILIVIRHGGLTVWFNPQERECGTIMDLSGPVLAISMAVNRRRCAGRKAERAPDSGRCC